MFEIGEYIVYGVKGVCRIEDITHIDISGADKDRLYYVLAPVGDGSGRIYAPTDNQKITMRKVISREEADQLIEDMPKDRAALGAGRQAERGEIQGGNEHLRLSCVGQHCKDTIYQKQERTAQGRRSRRWTSATCGQRRMNCTVNSRSHSAYRRTRWSRLSESG